MCHFADEIECVVTHTDEIKCVITNISVWHDSILSVTWRIAVCDMTHSYV